MDPETSALLYADESGEIVGVDEVQLLDEVPADRIPALRALLCGDDLGTRFGSLLLLAAWGDSDGLASAEQFLSSTGNEFDGLNPHRLHDQDRTYDLIADALSLAVRVRGMDPAQVTPHAERLLDMATSQFFEHGLQRLVTAIADPALGAETDAVVRRLARDGRHREASDLLPAVAATDPVAASEALNLFRTDTGFMDESVTGVATTLGRIRSEAAISELESLQQSEQPGAATAAKFALDFGF